MLVRSTMGGTVVVNKDADTERQQRANGDNFHLVLSINVLCIAVWICLSGGMVFYNKYLLSYFGFNFPITLTLWHMIFCSGLATCCVLTGIVKPLDIPQDIYINKIIPIAACYAGALWTSNAAYSIASVSFAQMVKAGMPVTVFCTGIIFGTERFSMLLFLDIVLITFGVGISAYGEAQLVMLGLVLLVISMFFEAVRLTLTQQLIQSSGLKFNPLTTLYYIAPPAAVFLSIPFLLMEVRGATYFLTHTEGHWHFILNGFTAFALNLAVFLLIGRTSALTMNICGLVKDWGTISLSVVVFQTEITITNIVGYLIAFSGVCGYNYLRLLSTVSGKQQPQQPALEQQTYEPLANDEKQTDQDTKSGRQQVSHAAAGGAGTHNHDAISTYMQGLAVEPSSQQQQQQQQEHTANGSFAHIRQS